MLPVVHCRALVARDIVSVVRSCVQHRGVKTQSFARCSMLQRSRKPSDLIRTERRLLNIGARKFSSAAPLAKELASAEAGFTENNSLINEEDIDVLYKTIELELKGHEDAVLDSYQWFLCKAAHELDITISRTWTPLRDYQRFSLLKSVFVHKKHMVQYELRTYYRVIQLKHLTGSTADTYLEYIERMLPEGVAMKVTKCAIEALPSNLVTEVKENEGPLEEFPGTR